MRRTTLKLSPVLTVGLVMAIGDAQAIDPLQELRACARMDDAADRADCYDALGQWALGEEAESAVAAPQPEEAPLPAAAAVPAAAASSAKPASAPSTAATPVTGESAASVASAPQALPDDIGGQQFEDKPDERYTDRVMSCRKATDDKWLFYFESGQVWKQVSSKRVLLDDDACQFGATISKDFFGFKMQIEGENSKVRISRIK